MAFTAGAEEYSKGAIGAQKVIDLPLDTAIKKTQLQTEQLRLLSFQEEAKIAPLKTQFEKESIEGKLRYMHSPTPEVLGAEQYALLTDAQKLTEEKKIIEQEEQRIFKSGMNPDDTEKALKIINTRKNKLESLSLKVQQQYDKHIGAEAAAISAVENEGTLSAYRQWKEPQFEAQAKASGIPEENIQAYVKEQMKSIPSHFDDKATIWKESELGKLTDSKTYNALGMEKLKTRQIAIAAEVAKSRDRAEAFREQQLTARIRMQEHAIEIQDKRATLDNLKAQEKTNHDTIRDAQAALNSINKDLEIHPNDELTPELKQRKREIEGISNTARDNNKRIALRMQELEGVPEKKKEEIKDNSSSFADTFGVLRKAFPNRSPTELLEAMVDHGDISEEEAQQMKVQNKSWWQQFKEKRFSLHD